MRIYHPLGVFVTASTMVAVCARAGTAQSPPTDTTAKKSASKVLTLSGCVGTDAVTSGRFVLSDAKGRDTYRLSGADVHEYVGRRVQVDGVRSRRFQIVGGLYSSPNVAAQAGAIDPARAALAAASGPAAGTGPLPEFRVKSVQLVDGSCPQP